MVDVDHDQGHRLLRTLTALQFLFKSFHQEATIAQMR